MPHIQVLDSHVADLIAAGEVVERPASVVKELMENAIDAGCTTLTVEIAHGGMSYIRVTDDGCGIPAGELETAFLRHATSKIRSEYDLEAIGTLGFRGEALAAIAAVSRVEVVTRTAACDFGAALTLEGGTVRSREEAGGPVGTTMIVRDLFFNTPARLKYMKKDAAEGAAVFAAVQREALARPEVAVKFIRDGRQELLTPGDGALKSAVYAVLGRDLALGLLPVRGSGEEGVRVEGFVSLPACCRASRNYQFFFVNGRFVKSRTMMAAMEQAYANDLVPIYCVGENLDEREAGKHFDVVKAQIEEVVYNLTPEQFGKLVIAYEPVWAIGTGKTATAEQAQEIHAYIRKVLAAKFGAAAEECPILYGGSCKPSNAAEIFAKEDVDGGLIGGAALKAEDFLAIGKGFAK